MRERKLVTLMIRSTYVVLCVVTIGVRPSVAAADLREEMAFDLPSQELPAALLKFASVADVQVTTSGELVEGKTSHDAIGTFDGREALQRMLKDTQLRFDVVDENTVLIVPIAQPKPAAAPSGKSQAEHQPSSATTDAPKTSFWERIRLAQVDQAQSRTYRSAQNPEPTTTVLAEVIVTAQKRAERLQEVPVPVTAISGETLTATNQLRIEDYYRQVPGLAVGVAGEGNAPALSIRGITTANDSNATVGIVIDDIPYGSSVVPGTGAGVTAPDIDPGDLTRIEVLRGPQGTLYGASSMGGLLKFVTIDPSLEQLSGRVQVGSTSVRHGDDPGYAVRANINVPLGDTFAVRASGFSVSEPGYIDNVETGEIDVNERENEGGRVAMLWSPSQAFSLKLSALYQDSQRLGTSDVDTSFGRDAYRQQFLPGTGTYGRQTEAYSATMTGQLGAVELTSVTGYTVDELTSTLDYTRVLGGLLVGLQVTPYYPAQVNRLYSDQVGSVKRLTQELRASLPVGDRVNWLFGAFYGDEDSQFAGENTAAFDTGEAFAVPFAATYASDFKEKAVFTTFTIDLADRWDVQLGGRYSKIEQDAPIVWTGIHAVRVFRESPHAVNNLSSDDDNFTYLVTPRFKVSDDLMVYLRLASGYRAGGPNNGCGQAADVPCTFGSDETRNYDLGAKGTLLDGALSFDASLYYIDWQRIQIAGLLNSTFTFAFTDNVSQARSRGAELSVEARPLTGMALSAWVAYNDATLEADLPIAPFQTYGRVGDRLPYGPRLSASLAVDQEFPLWGATSLSVGGSLSYVGERVGAFEQAAFNPAVPLLPREKFPSYTQLDLRARLAYDTWALSLFCNNVTDEQGVLRGGNDSAFNPNYFVFTRPRTFGLALSKDF